MHSLLRFPRQSIYTSFLLSLVAVLVINPSTTVHADTDVTCDSAALVAAVTAANTTPEADTLYLAENCVYSFTTASDVDEVHRDSALPRITAPITINGNGATLRRADGSPDFRLLYVLAGSLTANNLTVSGGRTPKNGGGLLNFGGTVSLSAVTISDNTAYASDNSSGWGGGIHNTTGLLTAGLMTITESVISNNTASINGGGIYSGGPMVALTVTDSLITGNASIGSPIVGNGNGGGIAASGGLAGALTLTGNTFSNNTAVADGGGLYALTNSPTPLTDNIFSGNSASHGGGILVVGPMTIVNHTFTGNTAARGGGFTSAGGGSTVTISGSTFTGNSAQIGGGLSNGDGLIVINSTFSDNSAAIDGGGLANVARLTLIGTSLTDNTAGNFGGGLFNGSPNVIPVTGSTITGNTADSGGGIFNYLGSLVVTSTQLADNTAEYGGGIFNRDTTILTGSELSGNTADLGGGIFNGDTTNITGSLLSGNKARKGGGIYTVDLVVRPVVKVRNSTIAGNSAEKGGASFNDSLDTSLTVSNSVVWGNSSALKGLGTINVKYSILQGSLSGGNLNADPLFLGAVPHASAPTSAGDYRLQPGSPALDAGNNAIIPADSADLDGDSDTSEQLPFDLDGGARLVNDVIDIGAYEIAPDAMPDDLLANNSFEVNLDQDSIPDGWAAKKATGDKLKCNEVKAHTGICAFLFVGGSGENAKLKQQVDISAITFSAGDHLLLSGFLKAGVGVSGKVTLSVRYAGVSNPTKVSSALTATEGYAKFNVPVLALTAGAVDQIVVTIKHKSPAGKAWFDTFRLFHVEATSRGLTRDSVIPPPAAPAGMRGSN